MSSKRNWIRDVRTVSTFPPEGLFTKDAETIARGMASKEVSPKGIASGIRMIQYFINRGGKGLSASRRRELERAKHILQERLEAEKESGKSKQHSRNAARRRTGKDGSKGTASKRASRREGTERKSSGTKPSKKRGPGRKAAT